MANLCSISYIGISNQFFVLQLLMSDLKKKLKKGFMSFVNVKKVGTTQEP